MLTPAIHIVIVDEHAAVREYWRSRLSADEYALSFSIAATIAEAESAQGFSYADILLINVAAPSQDQIASINKLIGDTPRIQAVLLTKIGDANAHIAPLIGTKKIKIVPLDASDEELRSAVLTAFHSGQLPKDDAQTALSRRSKGQRMPHDDLTPREIDILKELSKGKSNKEIALDLNLTEGTIKGYVSVVLSKLGVDDRAQAAQYAKENGII